MRYLTHPQVLIDKNIPVPQWSLSEVGTKRVMEIAGATSLKSTNLLISSDETKAQETAQILAPNLMLSIITMQKTHENDRNSTGFLEPKEFEKVATQFFTYPEQSIHGWESAKDAQTRIIKEIMPILTNHKTGDILIIGHGAVGTLLYCHLANIPISRKWDQPAGGGNFFSYDIKSQSILHHWQAMEQLIY